MSFNKLHNELQIRFYYQWNSTNSHREAIPYNLWNAKIKTYGDENGIY